MRPVGNSVPQAGFVQAVFVRYQPGRPPWYPVAGGGGHLGASETDSPDEACVLSDEY